MPLRPATPDEQRQLDSLARGSSAWRWFGAAWLGATGFLVVLGALYLITGARTARASWFVLVVGAVGFSTYLYLRRLSAPHIAAERASASADAAMAQVDETTFAVEDAIEVEESEDEGKHFYVKVRGGRVVFFSGQYLYDAVKTKRFPAERVTIVRTPASKIVLSLTTSGAYRPPSTVRKPFADRDHERGRVPQDGDAVSIDFDELRK
jgi:hypothetical protein